MTRGIAPVGTERELGRLAHREDQVERRAPGGAGELPTIRIHGSSTLPWSFNASARVYPFVNLDVDDGGFVNAKFHNLAVAQVVMRVYETDDAADFMERDTACSNPSGIGTHCFWVVRILRPGVYGARFQGGGSGGGVGGSFVGTQLYPQIEPVVLQSTPILQSRHFNRRGIENSGFVGATDIFTVEQADLDAAGNLDYVAASLAMTGNGAVDRAWQGEFVVHRLGDVGDPIPLTHEYSHPDP